MANAYMRFPNNILMGTRRLSLEQRGAYGDLLDLYLSRDGYLPDDDRMAAFDLAIDIRIWRRVKTALMADGKIDIVDGMIEPTGGKETLEICHQKSLAAKKGSDVRWNRIRKNGKENQPQNKVTPVATPVATRVASQQLSDSYGDSDNVKPLKQKKTKNANASATAMLVVSNCSSVLDTSVSNNITPKMKPSQFDTFWEEYPRKVGKGDARKAFDKATKKTDFDTLMEGVRKYTEIAVSMDTSFIPYPARWLNGERWQDEPTHNVNNPTVTQAGRTATGSITSAVSRYVSAREG